MYIYRLLCMVIVIGYTSCNHNEDISPQETNIENSEKIVLGKKLQNPYSIENMTKAIEKVRPSKLKSEGSLVANFLYVRFLPMNFDEMEILNNDTLLSLYNYPLDYEIVKMGQSYHDPNIPKNQITWQYTVVPSDYTFPSITYEILDYIYIPTKDEYDIEKEALILTNNYNQDTSLHLKADIVPSGQILIQDDVFNKDVPAIRVKVRARNWFRIDNVYTNSEGNFKMTEEFNGPVDIKLIFENEHARIRSTLINITGSADVSVANEVKTLHLVLSRRNRNTSTNPIPSGYRMWSWATVSNAIEEYRNICNFYGVGLPTNDIRVWVHRNDKSNTSSMSGAAPMLQGSVNWYNINTDKWYDYFSNVLWIPASNTIGNLFSVFAPDIVITYGSEVVSSEGLCELVFHEFSHASHYNKVGSGYWGNYINYIVSNNGYGNGLAKDADLCALGEMWGYHIGWQYTRFKYDSLARVSLRTTDNFQPLIKGGNLIMNTANGSWIPAGLLLDLQDNTTDIIRINNGVNLIDNANGYTNHMFYNALDSDIKAPQAFRVRLLQENSNLDQTDVNSLFQAYYY